MTKLRKLFAATALSLGVVGTSGAAQVSFDANPLGGGLFEAIFTVFNDTAMVLEEFELTFPETQFASLGNESAPADWDPVIVQPDSSISEDGLYDALAESDGIEIGQTLGGFSVNFQLAAGQSLPDTIAFSFFDPFTFAEIDTGDATLNQSLVPLPAPVVLLGSALGLLLARRRSAS